MSRRALAGVALVLGALALAAGPASAGSWVQVSCVNPDGSAASSEGWTSSGALAGYGSSNSVRCGPGAPMFGTLSAQASVPVGANETLQYAPPAGSTIAGGTLNVAFEADGGGTNASGTAVLYEPGFTYPDDVLFQCAAGLAPCSPGSNHYSGALTLPADAGGDVYVSAGCGGAAGQSCTRGGSDGNVSSVLVLSSRMLLSNSAVPGATDITGTALGKGVRGTAHLLMTASDPNGPGVYAVTVALDGRPVYAGTPNTNGGACVSLGTDPSYGAPMFDRQQPCPAVEQIALPVPTGAVSDAQHELTATVVDAAGNQATVLDQFITTSNPQLTPAPRGKRRVHMRFEIGWRFTGSHTRLIKVSTERAPPRGRVTVRCLGIRCPRLTVTSGAARHLKRVIGSLLAARFRAGQRLLITVTAPRLRAERIELLIRDGRQPSARLLTR
jgi:hypothetical protein